MKAKEFVLSKYPDAFHTQMINHKLNKWEYVILKGDGGIELITKDGADTASKAWTKAKNHILTLKN